MNTNRHPLSHETLSDREQHESGSFQQIWQFFASLKLTIAVLLLLAATSVIGTLIPQQKSLQAYYQTYGEMLFRIFYALDIFDMYYSWWFRLLIVLLATNIIVCTLHRLPATWRMATASPSRFRRFPTVAELTDDRPVSELKSLYEKFISGMYPRHHIEETETGFRISAEKGRWSRLSVVVVHLSVVLLLMGALVGSIFGFDGYVNIPEGGTADHIRLRNSNKSLTLPFKIRCDDFSVSFYDSGMPREYRSGLTILENDQPVLTRDIIVNDPLRYSGINLFQSSYGSMPAAQVTLKFTHRDTGKAFQQEFTVGQTAGLPESAGTFSLVAYNNDYHFQSHELGGAFVGSWQKAGGDPVEVALPTRYPTFDRMRKGEWLISIADYEKRHYTGLQVTRDPGVPLVYAGFILMIIGCYAAFFISHRKIGVEVISAGKGSQICVSGTSDKNKPAFREHVRKVAHSLEDLF